MIYMIIWYQLAVLNSTSASPRQRSVITGSLPMSKMERELKIVFVEDVEADIDLVYHELRRSKITYTHAHVKTAEAFEEALDRIKPDIVLSDFALPNFDGISAYNIKQKRCPDIPFIIISGTIGEERAVELIKSGVTDYVLKDKLFTLSSKIARALDDSEKAKKKRVADETLRIQNEKLFEIAVLQSHQVRGPISTIQGLVSIFNFDDINDPINIDIINSISEVTNKLDAIIRLIVEKTNDIEDPRPE